MISTKSSNQFNDYSFEDLLSETTGIMLKPIRKKNSVRTEGDFIFRRALAYTRKRIETSFSGITGRFPKKIHAVTPQGFALKVIGFILVFSIQFLQVASWVILYIFQLKSNCE